MQPSEFKNLLQAMYRDDVEFSVGPVANSSLIKVSGKPNPSCLIDIAKVAHSNFETRFHIWDYQNANVSYFTESDIKFMSSKLSAYKRSNPRPSNDTVFLIYVMGPTNGFPLMRMYQSWSEINESPVTMITVRTMDEAIAKIDHLRAPL